MSVRWFDLLSTYGISRKLQQHIFNYSAKHLFIVNLVVNQKKALSFRTDTIKRQLKAKNERNLANIQNIEDTEEKNQYENP